MSRDVVVSPLYRKYPQKKELATEKYETRKLSTQELQRLVLLQQFRTRRVVQQQYYKLKLGTLKRQKETNETEIAVSEGTNYFSL